MEKMVKMIDDISFITLKNDFKMEVTLCSFGAAIYELKLPNKNGRVESVVLTPTNLDDFKYSDAYYGKTIGRYSGRIDNAECVINNVKYHLEKNWNGINALHGGYKGISFANFDFEVLENESYTDVIYKYIEEENNLPGDVTYKITYRIFNDRNEITCFFNAITSKDTLVNLTNHTYFNLSGNGVRNVLHQKLQLLCDKYTRVDENIITLSIDPVNEVMDFRNLHEIVKYIYDDSIYKHTTFGYDHCFLKEDINEAKVAVMCDEVSGRRLTVSSSYPAIVCYAGCYPKDYEFNESKFKIGQYHSMCLECQFLPNGINMNDVEKAILKAGEVYSHYITYKFDLI